MNYSLQQNFNQRNHTPQSQPNNNPFTNLYKQLCPTIYNPNLLTHAQYNPSTKYLTLSSACHLSESDLIPLAIIFNLMKYDIYGLSLSGSTGFDDRCMARFNQECLPQLRFLRNLDLSRLTQVSHNGFEKVLIKLTQELSKLRVLDVSGNTQFSYLTFDLLIKVLKTGNSQLIELNLSNTKLVESQAIELLEIVISHTTIQNLLLSNNPSLGYKFSAYVLHLLKTRAHHHLQYLELAYCNVSVLHLKEINKILLKNTGRKHLEQPKKMYEPVVYDISQIQPQVQQVNTNTSVEESVSSCRSEESSSDSSLVMTGSLKKIDSIVRQSVNQYCIEAMPSESEQLTEEDEVITEQSRRSSIHQQITSSVRQSYPSQTSQLMIIQSDTAQATTRSDRKKDTVILYEDDDKANPNHFLSVQHPPSVLQLLQICNEPTFSQPSRHHQSYQCVQSRNTPATVLTTSFSSQRSTVRTATSLKDQMHTYFQKQISSLNQQKNYSNSRKQQSTSQGNRNNASSRNGVSSSNERSSSAYFTRSCCGNTQLDTNTTATYREPIIQITRDNSSKSPKPPSQMKKKQQFNIRTTYGGRNLYNKENQKPINEQENIKSMIKNEISRLQVLYRSIDQVLEQAKIQK